jgi:hypothetical protein
VRRLICPSGSHIAVRQRTVSPHRHCEEQRDEAIHSFLSWERWIASLRSQ